MSDRYAVCGVCNKREMIVHPPAYFEGGGYYSYPTSRSPRPQGYKQQHVCDYGMALCAICGTLVADYIMSLRTKA